MLLPGMKFHTLWPFAFGLLLLASMNSCTKTVLETQTDTLRATDTLRDTLGPHEAWVRFVSIFPASVATELELSTTSDVNSSLYTVAPNSLGGSYLPLRADTSFMFYISNPAMPGWEDSSLRIPVLGNTINTYALFLVDTSPGHPYFSVQSQRAVDSEKLTPPPADSCYVRFINGISDGSAAFDFDLNALGNSLFLTNGHSEPIYWAALSQYGLVRVGTHTIYLRTPGTTDAPLQLQNYTFRAGHWYTVIATGSLKENTGRINVDQE